MPLEKPNPNFLKTILVIVHEQLNDRDGTKTRKLSWPEPTPSEIAAIQQPENIPEPLLPQEQIIQRSYDAYDSSGVSRQTSMASSTGELTSPYKESGYGTMQSASYDTDMGTSYEYRRDRQDIEYIPEVPSQDYQEEPEEIPVSGEHEDEWSRPDRMREYGGSASPYIKKYEQPSYEQPGYEQEQEYKESGREYEEKEMTEGEDDYWVQPARAEYQVFRKNTNPGPNCAHQKVESTFKIRLFPSYFSLSDMHKIGIL